MRIISEPPTTPPSPLLTDYAALHCTAPVALGCHISTFNLNQVKKNRQFVRPFVSDIPFTSIPSADAAKKNRFCRVRRKTSSAASQPASQQSQFC